MKQRTSELIDNLNFEQLSEFFHLPLKEAAPAIGICVTALKRACRKNKIARWPHRKIKSLDRAISALSAFQDRSSPGKETASCELSVPNQIQTLEKQKEEIMNGVMPESSTFTNPFYFLLDLQLSGSPQLPPPSSLGSPRSSLASTPSSPFFSQNTSVQPEISSPFRLCDTSDRWVDSKLPPILFSSDNWPAEVAFMQPTRTYLSSLSNKATLEFICSPNPSSNSYER